MIDVEMIEYDKWKDSLLYIYGATDLELTGRLKIFDGYLHQEIKFTIQDRLYQFKWVKVENDDYD